MYTTIQTLHCNKDDAVPAEVESGKNENNNNP